MSLPEYKRALKQKSHVNMHDITKIAVKPWTKKTGCSLSILMSKEREEPAKLMISHVSHLLCSTQFSSFYASVLQAWGEDVAECHRALEKYFTKYKIDHNIPIWYCVFGERKSIMCR